MAGEKKPKSKSKHRNVQRWKKYKIEGDAAKPLSRTCPRCGQGIFMAEHKNRVSCGRCKYSETKK